MEPSSLAPLSIDKREAESSHFDGWPSGWGELRLGRSYSVDEGTPMDFVAAAPSIEHKLERSWTIRPESTLKNRVIDDVIRFLSNRYSLGPSTLFKYRLCLDEAITNAITHGCRGQEAAEVSIDFYFSDESWGLRIKDPGPGFDASQIPDPNDPRNDYRESGRGVLILERYTDKLVFSDGGSEQTFWMNTDGLDPA